MSIVSPSTVSVPFPRSELSETTPFQRDLAGGRRVLDVLGLTERLILRAEKKVGPEFGIGAAHPDLAKRLDHIDAVWTDFLSHAVHRADPRYLEGPLAVAPTDREEGVGNAGIRVDAQSGEEERLGPVILALVDAAVVGVAVTGCHVGHRHRHLVDRIFVQRVNQHVFSSFCVRRKCNG